MYIYIYYTYMSVNVCSTYGSSFKEASSIRFVHRKYLHKNRMTCEHCMFTLWMLSSQDHR